MSLQEIDNLKTCVHCLQQSIPDAQLLLNLECGDTLRSADHVSTLLGKKLDIASNVVSDYKIIFCCQSHDQQRLLKRYGKEALLFEVSTANVPFPIFGVFVPTNVDFQLVYLFMVQSRSNTSLRNGIVKLAEWNPDWSPKFLIVDYGIERLSMLDQLFPSK